MKKIILCGYMASGKTTIARLLSLATQIAHIDLDDIIVKEQGRSVQQIFKEDGEIKFRRLEHTALKGLLDVNDAFILSLGGGTPCYAGNHLLLQREDVISIYLKASIPEIITRVKAQGTSRPLIDNLHGQELQEFIGQHLFERSYYYNHAKHVVSTDGKNPETIVNEIVSLL